MPFVPLGVPPAAGGPEAWYVVRAAELLAAPDGGVTWPAAPPLATADTDPVFLGDDDGRACWAVGADPSAPAPEGCRWVPLVALGSMVTEDAWRVAGRAVQLVEWQRTSRYCGRCGTETGGVAGERARRCPACGLLAYPRLAPAVIVLVSRGDEVLLARNRRFRGRMFSTLAGFVEPGETLEEAVHREVVEEVGVRLGAVRYFASQPWPFPHSLMIGFLAEWAEGDPVPDGVEIAEAAWWRPDGLPELPPPLSIARRMIDRWLAEARGGLR